MVRQFCVILVVRTEQRQPPMMYQEPLELVCPTCSHCFQCSVSWILAPDRRCAGCCSTLDSLQDQIKKPIDEWAEFVVDVARIMALESTFKLSDIPDTEAVGLRTFGDAHEFLMERLGNSLSRAEVWDQLVSAVLADSDCHVPGCPTRSQPFVRGGWIKHTGRS